ncbi:hypothetical protein AB0J38_12325 [Streptomyces sp. NPDC050095]|uniref:hypothetical protein n=1 Tax=unclassified Streptomyces TaxID=2593676 RepID=UPI003413D337
MIGFRVGPATPSGRWGRLASVIGLVVLVIAHLAGTVHASTPAGSHLDVTVTACGHEAQQQPSPHRVAGPLPAHHHSSGDGHAEHLADRPRATGPDGPSVPGPDAPPPVPVAPAAVPGSRHLLLPGLDPPRAAHPAAARSLLGVWRQ